MTNNYIKLVCKAWRIEADAVVDMTAAEREALNPDVQCKEHVQWLYPCSSGSQLERYRDAIEQRDRVKRMGFSGLISCFKPITGSLLPTVGEGL